MCMLVLAVATLEVERFKGAQQVAVSQEVYFSMWYWGLKVHPVEFKKSLGLVA